MRGVIPMTAMAVILGIRVRVGAEDNLWRVKGEPTDGGLGLGHI